MMLTTQRGTGARRVAPVESAATPAERSPREPGEPGAAPLRLTGAAPYIGAVMVLAALGMVALLAMTRWAVGTSPDSVQYIRAARQLTFGWGATVAGQASAGEPVLIQHAPLYPMLLASGGLAGADPIDTARWLAVLVFGLNIVMVGLIVGRTSRNAAWPGVLAAALAAASAPVLTVHAMALSEPVFLFFTLAAFASLGRYVEHAKPASLVAAAAAVALACLSRYAGLACIAAGALALLWLPRVPLGRRCRDAFLFVAIGVTPVLAWMLRNLTIASTATNRELAFHPVSWSHAWQALYTASGWALIPDWAPDLVRVATWLCVAGGAAVVLLPRLRGPRAVPPAIAVLVLFVGVYGGFLAASISFVDANTPLDDRILLPVFVAAAIVGLHLLDRAWPAIRQRAPLRVAIMALALSFLGVHAARTARIVLAAHENGWGYSSRAWRESPALTRVRALSPSTLLYSNAPNIVYLHTGRTPGQIPRRRSLMSDRPNAAFADEMSGMRADLHAACGVIVYIRGVGSPQAVPSASELISGLSLRVLVEADGIALLTATTCQS